MSILSARHLAMLEDRAVRGGVPDCWVRPIVKLISDLRRAREEIKELRKANKQLARPGVTIKLTRAQQAAAKRIGRMHDAHCLGWLMNQLGPGNNIGLRLSLLDCENLDKVKLVGEQHECFEDTLP